MPASVALVQWLAVSLNVLMLTAFLTPDVSAEVLPQVALDQSQFRRPVAIAGLDDSTAVVANRCGTISVIDLSRWAVVAEYKVGGRLTDLAIANGLLLVTDAERSTLNQISVSRKDAQVVWQLPVPAYPVTVHVSADGRSCSIASKWARRLTFIDLQNEPAIKATVDPGFCPGEQLEIPSRERLLVADAFSGRLAVIDTQTHEVQAVHEFGAHNIRGLAVSRDRQQLLVSHQILNDAALPRRSDIIWGVMIDNMVRTAKLDDILNGKVGAIYGGQTINVGYAGQGAGDPDTLFVDEAGRAVIALAGVDEVSIGKPDSRAFQRIAVGRRPVDLLPFSEGRFVVVNELSDSLTLVDLTHDAGSDPAIPQAEAAKSQPAGPSGQAGDSYQAKPTQDDEYDSEYAKGRKADSYDGSTTNYNRAYLESDFYTAHLSLGPTPKPGPVERGEQLFFSARLSHASWFSCHSCHVDGHSNGGTSDTFGDDTSGAPKRVLSLLGVGETGPWGWNGKKSTLSEQVHQSAASTMRGRGVSDQSASDIAAFLKTLQPPPPFEPAINPVDQKLVHEGRRVFETLNCADCHAGTTMTSSDVYDVGLEDERGLRHFNPPTLRAVGYREALFHDKRAKNLEEVFTKFEHQIEHQLTERELTALLRYLRSL